MKLELRTAEFRAASPIDKNGLVRGVSVITEGPALGHDIHIDAKSLETAQKIAAAFSGGVKVKMDHSHGLDRIVGFISKFRIDGKQLRGDMQLLSSNPARPFVAELIERQPTTFGLSVAFSFTADRIDGKDFVRFEDIYSIDLVDRPAANPGGLFSNPTRPLFGISKVEAAFAAQIRRKEELASNRSRERTSSIPAGLSGLARVTAQFQAEIVEKRLEKTK